MRFIVVIAMDDEPQKVPFTTTIFKTYLVEAPPRPFRLLFISALTVSVNSVGTGILMISRCCSMGENCGELARKAAKPNSEARKNPT